MNWTPEQYKAYQMKQIGVKHDADVKFGVAITDVAEQSMVVTGMSTDEAKLNKTERAWLAELRSNHKRVGIQDVTLKLADDCRYTPDFNTSDGWFTFWEVKGFWRDDARVKIKVAARMFPWARFIAVQRDGKGWKQEVIKP